ncbi:MAG: TIGR00282 family metallophosphoesterase [Spirochaetaceae bacterium]|nr:MAG: TIGR00282 family metallophosphoesterase [Spirochaetaceae bacterium]
MPAKEFTVLILGDIIGRSGVRAVVSGLSSLSRKYNADFVLANGENAADGFGITPEIATQLFGCGVHVITTGNHIWQQREIYDYLDQQETILRPANYPGGNPGHGHCVVEVRGVRVAVLNLQGRRRLYPIDCPFRKAREILRKLESQADVVLVDVHAEATDEKEALAFYLDGSVNVVVGTHTHIQTADDRILPGGTGYMTDLGACGPADSVIGFDPVISVERARSQLPLRNEVSDNKSVMHGAVVTIQRDGWKTDGFRRFREESLV